MAPKKESISLKKKLEILAAVDKKNKSKIQVAKDFDIPKSTLSTILKNRGKYENAIVSDSSVKKIRPVANPELEQALLLWLKKIRAQNCSVDGNLLKNKAEEFGLKLGIGDQFKQSDGWLAGFKRRHNVTFKKISGENGGASLDPVDEWRNTRLKTILTDYDPSDIYNAKETGLFFKILPNRTFALVTETCQEGQLSKERITVMLATNMTGTHKLKLLVIGKYEKPRSFKNIKTFPTKYSGNTKVLMSEALFEQWLKDLDQEMTNENRKILLIVDDCTVHTKFENLTSVKLELLPLNLTPLIQPMEQGIIQCFKQHYRKAVLGHMVITLGNDQEYEIDLLRAMYLSASAWDCVSAEVIQNSFNLAGFRLPVLEDVQIVPSSTNTEVPMTNSLKETRDDLFNIDGDKLLNVLKLHEKVPQDVTFDMYCNIDESVICTDELSDETILARVQSSSIVGNVSVEQSPLKLVTHKEAAQAVDLLRRYFERLEGDGEALNMTLFLEYTIMQIAVNNYMQ